MRRPRRQEETKGGDKVLAGQGSASRSLIGQLDHGPLL